MEPSSSSCKFASFSPSISSFSIFQGPGVGPAPRLVGAEGGAQPRGGGGAGGPLLRAPRLQHGPLDQGRRALGLTRGAVPSA